MTFSIDYIEFPTDDHAASRAFFRDALGFGLVDYGPDYTALEGAGLDGGLDPAETRVAATMAVMRTDDLDAAERAVTAGGGEITRPQFDFPGGRRFHFRAPGGIELAVYVERTG